jgi:predicted nucleic acid-binding protein
MRVCVVDASAIGALIFGESKAEQVADTLRDARLVAPALLWFELASVCLKKISAHPEKEKELLAVFKLLSRLAITRVEVDHYATVGMAREMGLTTYDASYLWMARELKGKLITLDERLAGEIDSL